MLTVMVTAKIQEKSESNNQGINHLHWQQHSEWWPTATTK